MNPGAAKTVRCAIYTRVSTDQGLEQDFNSLDAQYDAAQAYIRSRMPDGPRCAPNTTTAAFREAIPILLPEGIRPEQVRPIRSETRARLIAAIARGRRWLDEFMADPTTSADSIAKREKCSTRKINMTISLAFLAPNLVKAAIDGRLPHGMGVARLTDLPAEWSRQHQMLGLPAQ
jgi:hypothetical protein